MSSGVKRKAKDPKNDLKCQKYELSDKPTFYLTECMIDNSLINYYNKRQLHCISTDTKDSTFLRRHESKFTENTPCLYDHHSFNGPSFGIPISYNFDKNEFKLWGKFCSLECARAYIDKENNSKRDKQLEMLALCGRKIYGRHTTIERAPSIFLLDTYGGPLSIDDFRSEFSSNRMWICNTISGKFTHHVFDVYLNDDTFEYYNKTPALIEKEKDKLTLKRRYIPAHVPKRSLMTMLGKKQS